MNRTVLIVFTACFLVSIASAQTSATDAGTQDESKQEKLELRTVVGCLSQTANTYVITGGAPGPKQFRIVGGDTSALKGKIGQSVKVVGMVGESDPKEVASPPYNEGSTTGATYKTIVAQKIKVMGGLCSFPGQEWKGEHP